MTPHKPTGGRPEDIPQDVWDAAEAAFGAHEDPYADIARAILAERERCIRATIAVCNEGGDAATCLSIAEELRCPDIVTKRASAIRGGE